ncbi:e3 ubiquitin-protein ligase UBR2 [Caerostris darwini]|uniref:E3 ubiquitin-protein ligase n=1 Tax=Caerostris darwini TaxID=1538125 RepID=A0AAV4Q396_9ARAC|nr:e3 ubiquitin-protein ligase UBR2 [Caerostris darwini]
MDLDSSLLPEVRLFDEDLVGLWKKKFETKCLSDVDFKEYWVKNVSIIYQPSAQSYGDESIIFTPLEQFICGTRNTAAAFEDLKKLNDSPALCGKVFKAGEPTYSCRQCGLDPTCVLCVDCFTHSEHRNHRYKMSTSGGGGYCDCGDKEAWKAFSFCDNHHAKSEDMEDSNPLDRLPIDLIERFRLVLKIILKYCQTMLTWEQPVNLPADLQFPLQNNTSDYPDTYCTILYNDETHTYEQVIDTLTKAINCSKKIAIDYATTIDREGRSMVKCSSFSECNQVRHYIERVTSRLASKLKVSVMHTEIIAHQTFALKLLGWLQAFMTYNKGFCYILTEEILHDNLLHDVMCADTSLWKTARNLWHQLFITGMLMDMKCKKVFAKSFITAYPTLMKEFIADDHDHSISITSLSVQIFTVPTLAHQLIQEHDAMSILLRTFISECKRCHVNAAKKLYFQRNLSSNNFRRAQYMLYDLTYLIAVTPSEWNDALRKNIYSGMKCFFELIEMMQDMDPVVRQVGQHVEYEAEWESGINLQLKIAPLSTLLLSLCCNDYTAYVKTLRSNIRHFVSSQPKSYFVGIELADHSASCIEYDVSSDPVSIHLPLVRFMAGLLLHLDRFNLTYQDPNFNIENVERPSPEQLMELPLRTLVMLAQFRAGMWRRNGYSLLNQVYFYHNVRLRDEMFDRDIQMLQIAASMIESNEFLIHLIYKYGLLNWADEGFDGATRKPEEDNIRQVLTVAEEFLSLVLIILSERFTPFLGEVTEAEKIKKEIIQLLCMEPMPHSQLHKLLPRSDPNLDVALETIIKEVAAFKKANGPGIGKYELKPEFYKCFNPFYYHYTREEQSKAEEVQMKRKKQQCEEVCCPPPVPPKFTPRFAIITNILQCDVLLHIMELILKRTLNLHSSAFSETQLEKVLHLIGLALHEEERATKTDEEGSFFCFTAKANKRGLLNLLDECLKCPRVDICGETQKDLISWVINKYKYVESLRNQNKEKMEDSDTTSASTSSSRNSAKDRKRKTELAAARRTRIMAQMSAMQKNFIKEHAEMFKETIIEDSNLSKSEMDIYAELRNEDPVCFQKDPNRKYPSTKVYTCILCREDQELTCSGRALVLSAFVQRSSILSKNRKHQFENPLFYDPLMLSADLYWSVHSSTCGHVMHSDCWQKFFESVVHKEQRRPVRFGRHTSFDVEKKEFLCPLCERLSNTVIPLIPPISTLVASEIYAKTNDISVDEWLLGMKKLCKDYFRKVNQPEERTCEVLIQSTLYQPECRIEDAVKELPETYSQKFKDLFSVFENKHLNESGPCFSQNLIDMMKLFSEAIYTVGLHADIDYTDNRIAGISWDSCTYTIHAMEWLLRDKKKALFGAHSSRNALCLDGIIRFCASSLQIFHAEVVRTSCIRLLQHLLVSEVYLATPLCCLEMDAFSMLVFLVLSMPVLFKYSEESEAYLHPLGTTLDKYILHICLAFHFIQVLLTYPFNEEEGMDMDNQSSVNESSSPHDESVTALLFYEEVRTASAKTLDPAPSGHTIVHCLKSGSLPFLRCAAIFFHVLTDVPPPVALQELRDNEFESICAYLGLPPTLDELLASTSLKQLALSWTRHPRILSLLTNTKPTIDLLVRQPLSINKLVPLPSDYSDLINSVSQFTCPNSDGDDSRNPTMCLVCGEVLCSQSYCCQIDLGGSLVGACTHHAYYCGSGVGIFLRIRDCKILLLSDKNKGCFTAPPYVDEYGETDQGLYRGNPLHLCRERYEELHELWLSHNIPERVSHNMEQSTTLPNWQLL